MLDRKIADHLTRHIEDESALLATYEQVGAASESEHIRYLVELIAEDERRHHRLLIEMLNRLDSDAVLRELPDSTPRIGRPNGSPELRLLTKQLLAVERRDARDLRKLKRELKPRRKTTLFGLIVELIELDTKKHTRILRFILAHLDG